MKSAAPLFALGVVACTASAGELGTDNAAVSAASTGALSFAQYHSQAEIHAYLTSMATEHPDFVRFEVLGQSRQGREIAYLVVSNKDPATVPALYFNGTHHGDEWSSTEGILGLADHLITHRADATVSAILDGYAVYLQPLVNPDGHQARTREDATGVDPNRDYSYPGTSDASSFKVPEIKLVKALVDRVKPRAAAAYHSGIEEVLWSWCYTGHATADDELLAATGKSVAEAMGFDRYLQSYDDYATTGEFIDYTYANYKTLALTFEVSTAKTPSASQLSGVVANSVKGALAFIDAVRKADAGTPPVANARIPGEGRGRYGAAGVRTTPRLE